MEPIRVSKVRSIKDKPRSMTLSRREVALIKRIRNLSKNRETKRIIVNSRQGDWLFVESN